MGTWTGIPWSNAILRSFSSSQGLQSQHLARLLTSRIVFAQEGIEQSRIRHPDMYGLIRKHVIEFGQVVNVSRIFNRKGNRGFLGRNWNSPKSPSHHIRKLSLQRGFRLYFQIPMWKSEFFRTFPECRFTEGLQSSFHSFKGFSSRLY